MRRADVGSGLSAEGDQVVDNDDQLTVMVAMRDEGKIGAIGLSAVDLERLKRALPAGIALLAPHALGSPAAAASRCRSSSVARSTSTPFASSPAVFSSERERPST